MLLYISTFFYNVEHKKGDDHTFRLCDLLSRMYENDGKLKLAENSKKPLISCCQIKDGDTVEIPVLNVESNIVPDIPVQEIHSKIKLAQLESKHCRKIKLNPPSKFMIENDVIYKVTKNGKMIYCPPFYSRSILNDIHRHESAKNLVRRVNNYRIWLPDKYKAISAFVANCDKCAPSRSLHLEKYVSNTISRPTLPFQTVAIDISGFGTDNNFLVYVCVLTKYIFAKVLKNMSSSSVKTILLEAFTLYGLPNVILSDNATFGILHRRSSVMNSRGNGICEAAMKRIQNRTRIYQPKIEELPSYLGVICFQLNTQLLEGNKFSSFQKVYHRDATWAIQTPNLSKTKKMSLSDPIKRLYEDALEIQEKMMQEISSKRSLLGLEVQKIKLKEGDLVRIRQLQKRNTNKKVYQPFSGEKYKIVKINRFTKVCKISELVDDEAFHPKQLNVHARFLLKIPQHKIKDDDFEPIISEKIEAIQPANSDILKNGEIVSEHEPSEGTRKEINFDGDDISLKDKQNVAKPTQEITDAPKSKHHMSLRNRR